MAMEESDTPTQCTRVLPCDGYRIASWCPTPDASGPPTAVIFLLPVEGIELGLRLKSRRAVNELILALQKHRDDVFPESAKPSN